MNEQNRNGDVTFAAHHHNVFVLLSNVTFLFFYASASDRYLQRHYVFGLSVCECMHLSVHPAMHPEK